MKCPCSICRIPFATAISDTIPVGVSLREEAASRFAKALNPSEKDIATMNKYFPDGTTMFIFDYEKKKPFLDKIEELKERLNKLKRKIEDE